MIHRLKQKREFEWKYHVRYLIVAVLVIAFLPYSIAKYAFTPLTMTVVGSFFPVYMSIYAVCTPGGEDDTDWLKYWTIGGIFFVATEWVDDVIASPEISCYWLKSATFFLFWLYYPRTSGALLIDERFTQRFIVPRVRPLEKKMFNFINNIVNTLVNAIHLYLLWIFFMFLPSGLKRLVAVAVGTVYPFVASVQAITTDEFEDDAYWLIYWSCYGILFLLMDLL